MDYSSSVIDIIIGPMFSGKTTELSRRISRYECIGKKPLIVNSIIDNRIKGDFISTHNNEIKNAVKVKKLMYLINRVEFINSDIIGIDEAQFFSDLLEFVIYIDKLKKGKILIISGLDGDCLRNTFGQILECIPYCNNITKLSSMCMICKNGTKGLFSKRIVENNNQILVGNDDNYKSVCRKCFNQIEE